MYLAFNGINVNFSAQLVERLKREIGDGKTLRFPQNVYKLYEMSQGSPKRMGPKSRAVNYTDTVSLEITPENWMEKGEIQDVKYSKSTKSQNVRVTYYESSTPGLKIAQVMNYKPSAYKKPGLITANNYMQWFYLSVCSRTVKGSANEGENTRRRYMMEIFDAASSATKENMAEMAETIVRAKVLLPELSGGLAEHELVNLSKVLFIDANSWKNIDMLKRRIIDTAKADEISPGLSGNKTDRGWAYVAKLIKDLSTDSEDMEMRANIQRSIERRLIYHNQQKQAWFYCDPNVKGEVVEIEQIMLTENTSIDHIQALMGYMKLSKKNYTKLLDHMKHAKITPGLGMNNVDNIKNMIAEIDKDPEREEELVALYIELINYNDTPTYRGKLNKLKDKYPETWEGNMHLANWLKKEE